MPRTATLDEPEHGLTESVLQTTDVLIWWGHMAHHEVDDGVVERVYQRVLAGMGLVVLHSGHFSKIFVRLMGSSCNLRWREIGEKQRIWVIEPGHPIAAGLPLYFEIEPEETYGERFDIPAPDTLVFLSWLKGAMFFEADAATKEVWGKYSIFNPGMKHTRHIIIRWSSGLSLMQCAGRGRHAVSSPSLGGRRRWRPRNSF